MLKYITAGQLKKIILTNQRDCHDVGRTITDYQQIENEVEELVNEIIKRVKSKAYSDGWSAGEGSAMRFPRGEGS